MKIWASEDDSRKAILKLDRWTDPSDNLFSCHGFIMFSFSLSRLFRHLEITNIVWDFFSLGCHHKGWIKSGGFIVPNQTLLNSQWVLMTASYQELEPEFQFYAMSIEIVERLLIFTCGAWKSAFYVSLPLVLITGKIIFL